MQPAWLRGKTVASIDLRVAISEVISGPIPPALQVGCGAKSGRYYPSGFCDLATSDCSMSGTIRSEKPATNDQISTLP